MMFTTFSMIAIADYAILPHFLLMPMSSRVSEMPSRCALMRDAM